MQAVMLEKALYKVPHEIGLFEAPSNVEFSDDEDETGDQAVDNDDDDFKTV